MTVRFHRGLKPVVGRAEAMALSTYHTESMMQTTEVTGEK